MQVREGEIADAAGLAHVFYKAVRDGPSPYSDAQRAAWAPSEPTKDDYAARVRDLYLAVAEDNRKIVGFMAMKPDGYVDLAFILPAFRSKGAFRNLFEMMEHRARKDGTAVLRTHASLMAEPAFRAVGFSVIQRETEQRAGQSLPRVEMEKYLT